MTQSSILDENNFGVCSSSEKSLNILFDCGFLGIESVPLTMAKKAIKINNFKFHFFRKNFFFSFLGSSATCFLRDFRVSCRLSHAFTYIVSMNPLNSFFALSFYGFEKNALQINNFPFFFLLLSFDKWSIWNFFTVKLGNSFSSISPSNWLFHWSIFTPSCCWPL